MYTNFKIKSIAPKLIMSVFATLLMGSCTVYRYPEGASGDGIYSSSRTYREQANSYPETNNYYKQYFQSKQGSYTELLVEDNPSAIFTDVEAYNSREYIGEDGYVYSENISQQEQGYAGWGNNKTSVSINLYSYPGSYYNSFYGYWGYPYYNYGYYNPRWYGGFSWWYGWNGFYSPFYHSPSYYYGYGSHNYYRPYYNNVSYNRGRRNSDYRGRSTTTSGRTANYNTTRGQSSLSSDVRRGNTNSTISGRGGSTTTNSNLRRGSSINSNRTSNTLNSNTRREATNSAHRVTFPQQSTQRDNSTSPVRSQQMRRQTQTNNSMQRPSINTNTPTRNSNQNMRSSSPSRSSMPSMRSSSPSRGSSAPASRSGGGGSRGRS